MTAVEIYHAEKAAYVARNGNTSGVALMPRRKPRKAKKLRPPQGINNLKVHNPNRRQAAAAERARRRAEWTAQKRAYGKMVDPPVRPRYRGGERKPTHCMRGHEYTQENTYVLVNKSTNRKQRVCLACRRQWGAEWLARKKAASA